MLRIKLMGELRVELDGAQLNLPSSQNARALLAVLARADGPMPRAAIARSLWPVGLESSARDSLNTELHKLRKDLGSGFDHHLIRTRLKLALSGDVTTDVEEIERAIAHGDLERALRGNPGVFLADVAGDWVEAERRRVHAHLARQFHRAASRALAGQPNDAAVESARRALELEPGNEGIAVTLIKLLARLGRHDEAQAEARRRIATYIESGRKAPSELYDVIDNDAAPAPVVTAASSLLDALDNPEQPLTTGIPNLDEIIIDLPRGLVAVAGRPSMGMSSLLTTLCINTACRDPVRSVLFFTPDADEATVAQRLISNHASIRVDDLRRGRMKDARKWQRIVSSAAWLEEAPIFLLDRFDITATEIESLVNEHAQQQAVGLIVIDDLRTVVGHLTPEAASDAMHQLRRVSRALNVPLVVGVPVEERAEHRLDKRPLLGDLPAWVREARPDLIVGLYRDEFYHYDTDRPGELDLIVMDNRRGGLGEAHTTFQPQMARVLGLTFADEQPASDVSAATAVAP